MKLTETNRRNDKNEKKPADQKEEKILSANMYSMLS